MQSLAEQKRNKRLFFGTIAVCILIIIGAYIYNANSFVDKEVCQNMTVEIPFDATLIGYVVYNDTVQEFPFNRDSSLLGNVSFKYVQELCSVQKVRK